MAESNNVSEKSILNKPETKCQDSQMPQGMDKCETTASHTPADKTIPNQSKKNKKRSKCSSKQKMASKPQPASDPSPKSDTSNELLSKSDLNSEISPISKPNNFSKQNQTKPNQETEQSTTPPLNKDPLKPQLSRKKFHAYIVVRNVQKDSFNAENYLRQLLGDASLEIGAVISSGEDIVTKCSFSSHKDAYSASGKCRTNKISLFFLKKLPKKYLDSVKLFESSEEGGDTFCKKQNTDDFPVRKKLHQGSDDCPGKKKLDKTSERKKLDQDSNGYPGMKKQNSDGFPVRKQLDKKSDDYPVRKNPDKNSDDYPGIKKLDQGKNDQPESKKLTASRGDLTEEDKKIPASKKYENKNINTENSSTSTETPGATGGFQKDLKSPITKFLTSVFVTIEEVVKESLVVGFLKARMAIRVKDNFKISSFLVNEEESITRFTLNFGTKAEAIAAAEEFKKSNVNSDTQIKVFLTSVDDTIEERKKKLVEVLRDIDKAHDNMLNKHLGKLNIVKKKIEDLKTGSRNISVMDYQRVEEEKLALESQLWEMLKQKDEYIIYVTEIKSRIQESVYSENFQTISDEEMKRFGIEKCRLEANLPIYGRRREILELIGENQVVVMRGETGSGKSTQLVQFLYQAGYSEKGIICCTQPRKVACLSLAERVANELATRVGNIVGYKSGAKRQFNNKTKIMFQTHHSLLNICLKDPKLEKYSCIIIDEAHERSIFTDILISIMKKCLPVRRDLKLIISSATIEVGVFSEYFNHCPVLEISGRAFPVEVIWREPEEQHEDFNHVERRSVEKAIQLHKTEGQGDILVFLTSPQETEKCKEDLDIKLATQRFSNYQCFAFHGQMPPENQQEVFNPLPEGQRKIIFATNSAETSITITGVKYVIDSGLAKEKLFDPVRNTNTLRIEIISRSAAEQRKGRAGRTCPGVCYRLYTRKSFEDMRPTTRPEIQRIHLGQALLMLLEMGIDPMTCDFVEPPCEDARLSAMKTLEDLGCIRDKTITDLGKFLVKIPLEPRLAVMVKLGHDQGIVYDSIVFAVLHSYNSNSIFYRNGSDQDRKRADQLKLRFCDKKGDGVTFLKVFEEWTKQPENRRNRWCFDNKINSKTLRAARETISEIITVLKKEFKINVKEDFTRGNNRDEKLQKMAMYGFFGNVCYHMGQPRWSYFSCELDQRVYAHPGSSLSYLNDFSRWLVFGSFLRTSKDFITTLTPIEESWIEEIRQQRNSTRDIVKEADEKRLVNTHTEGLGPATMREFIGVKYTNLRQCEDELSQNIQTPVVLEVDRDFGEIRLFSTLNNLETVSRFKEMIKKVRDSIASKSQEYYLGTKNNGCGVRIVLGTGGEGQLVLMNNEYRKVSITKPNIHDNSLTRIMEKFSRFGEIVEVFEESRMKESWGILTFDKPADAVRAVKATKSDKFAVAEPVIRLKNNKEFQLKANMRWCRRPLTGLGYADVNPLILAEAARLRHIQVNEKPVEISLNDRNSLVLRKLPPTATFIEIKNSLCDSLGFYDEDSRKLVKRINLLREKVNTTADDLMNIKKRIQNMIRRCGISSANFEVLVNEPKQSSDIQFSALLKFDELEEGMRICKKLNNQEKIDNQVVRVIPDVSATIIVPKMVYEATKTAIDEGIQFHRNDVVNPIDVELTEKYISHGRVALKLIATNPTDLAKIRDLVAMEIKGDVLECWKNENYRLLFLENGRRFLKHVGLNTNTHIAVDERKFTLSFYGNIGDITRAKTEINNFIGDHLEERCREIQLNGENQPRGLMKQLVKTYGLNLETLIEETEITSVLLNHSKQYLKITGSPEAVNKAFRKISFLAQKLKKKKPPPASTEKSLPECVICMMEVEGLSKFQRLEYCGHVYCLDCLHQQLNVAIQNKELPVVCGEAGCDAPFIWQDFRNCFSKTDNVDVQRLVSAAVDRYVMDNSTSYKHCVTPDCPLIYRVTSGGKASVCRECRVRFCTHCHVVFHEGLTCYQFQNNISTGESEMEKYIQENSHRVKKCPKCSVPVEKKFGCNHMCCLSCRVHFCWKCLAQFSDSGSCYAHMNRAHGDIGIDYIE